MNSSYIYALERFGDWVYWLKELTKKNSIEANLDEIPFENIYGIETFNNMIRDMILDD